MRHGFTCLERRDHRIPDLRCAALMQRLCLAFHIAFKCRTEKIRRQVDRGKSVRAFRQSAQRTVTAAGVEQLQMKLPDIKIQLKYIAGQ